MPGHSTGVQSEKWRSENNNGTFNDNLTQQNIGFANPIFMKNDF